MPRPARKIYDFFHDAGSQAPQPSRRDGGGAGKA